MRTASTLTVSRMEGGRWVVPGPGRVPGLGGVPGPGGVPGLGGVPGPGGVPGLGGVYLSRYSLPVNWSGTPPLWTDRRL